MGTNVFQLKCFRGLSLAGAALLLACFEVHSQEQSPILSGTREESLNRFLWYQEGGGYPHEPTDVRYLHAFVDLNGDGKEEAIVYFASQCGSGGCGLLILTPQDSWYKQIGYVAITRLPIRVLNRSYYGWRSLTVWVQGGGIQPGYEGELVFNGEIYTSNVNYARKVDGQVPGEVLIPDQTYEFPSSGFFGTIPQLEHGKGKVLYRPTEQAGPPITALTREAALRRSLQDHLRGTYFTVVYIHGEKSGVQPSEIGGYFHAFADLNGDGKDEAIVHLTGPSWWSNTIILTPEGSRYRIVDRVPGRPPIRVLPVSTNGWRNLGVWKAPQESALTGNEEELAFDGKDYSPLPIYEEKSGEIVIPEAATGQVSTPLFPEGP